jgi:hypothetical protein
MVGTGLSWVGSVLNPLWTCGAVLCHVALCARSSWWEGPPGDWGALRGFKGFAHRVFRATAGSDSSG